MAHPTDAIVPCSYQLIGGIDTVRTASSLTKGQLEAENPIRRRELESGERTRPFSEGRKLNVETPATIKQFWIAVSVSFVGIGGHVGDTHGRQNRITGASV